MIFSKTRNKLSMGTYRQTIVGVVWLWNEQNKLRILCSHLLQGRRL